MFDIVNFTLASAVASAGTVVVGYPSGRGQGNYDWSPGKHVLYVAGNKLEAPEDFTLSFGTNSAGITVTNGQSGSWAASAACRLQLDRPGVDSNSDATIPVDPTKSRVLPVEVHLVDLGSPVTADADGYCASQDVTSAGVFSVDTTASAAIAAAALAGVADVPRNVVAAWTTSAAITITGTDEYGATLIETATSAVTFTGKKAFKKVTGIAFDVNVTGVTVGTGDILGLPAAVAHADQVLGVFQDGSQLPSLTATTAWSSANIVSAISAISSGNAVMQLVPETSATNAAAEINANFIDVAKELIALTADVDAIRSFVGMQGTFAAASVAKATGSTADVRGTYDPVSALNGDRGIKLLVVQHTKNNKGVPQYDG